MVRPRTAGVTDLRFYSTVNLAVWIRHTGQAVGNDYHRLDQMMAVGSICSLQYWSFPLPRKEPIAASLPPQLQVFRPIVAETARSARSALNKSTAVEDRDCGS